GAPVGAGAAIATVAAAGLVVREHAVADVRHRRPAKNGDRAALRLTATTSCAGVARAAVAAAGHVARKRAVLDHEGGTRRGDEHPCAGDKVPAGMGGGGAHLPGAAVVAAGQVVGEGAVRDRGTTAAVDRQGTAVEGAVAGERAGLDDQGRTGVAEDPAA